MDRQIKMCCCLYITGGHSIRVEHSRAQVEEIKRKGNVELDAEFETGSGSLFVKPKDIMAVMEFPTAVAPPRAA